MDQYIRELTEESQRLLFGMTRSDAMKQAICLACRSAIVKGPIPTMPSSLCQGCDDRLIDAIDAKFPLSVRVFTHGDSFDAVSVSPHWDGFTMLNAHACFELTPDERRTYCDEAISSDSVIQLPDKANPSRRIFIVPNVTENGKIGTAKAIELTLKLLTAIRNLSPQISSLLITQFGSQAIHREHLLGVYRGILLWGLLTDYGLLKSVLFESHPNNTAMIDEFLCRLNEG